MDNEIKKEMEIQWEPGETYRVINGQMYVRVQPSQWLSDALIDEYFEEQPAEERARYECQKYMQQHPRKAAVMTQEDYDQLYEKYLKKFKKEEEKKKHGKQQNTDSTTRRLMAYAQALDSLQRKEPDTESMAQKEIQETEVIEEDKAKLPVLNFDRQYMNNTKISRILSTKPIPVEEVVSELKIPINDKIINLVDIWRDKNITLSTNNITQFDMAVMDAAYTIMCSGYMVLTAEWIARVLSGNPDQKITPQKIGAIRRSIDKLRSVHIKIDCKDEINARRDTKGKIDKFVYESYLLPLDKIEARYEANGKEIVAYPVLTKPALYRYAEIVHQIVDVPAELLDTHEEFRDTDEAILIKRYVIKRVAQIVSKNKLNSNKISFLWNDIDVDEERGLFPELGYIPDDSDAWRDKKRKINKIVKLTLASLKEKEAIKDFEVYREDGTKNPASPIMGYKIFY